MKLKLLIGIIIILVGIGIVIQYNAEQEERIDTPLTRPDHVDDRQWHRWLMRGGKIEPEKMVAARKTVKRRVEKYRKSNNQKDAGLRSWVNFGPGDVGGRVRAIALQPTKGGGENIFIGAAGGGIYKSENGGLNWSANNDFAPSMAVTSIVVDPSNSSILYASTGEGVAVSTIGIPGAGIYKSTDGGSTWDQLPSTNNDQFYWVNKLAIDPNDGDHLFAVTTNLNRDGGFISSPFGMNGALYESLDGGGTWTKILEDQGILTDVEFHPTFSERVVVSGRGTLKVYNAANQSWDEKVTSLTGELPEVAGSGRIEVAISPLNAAYVIYALLNRSDFDTGQAHVFRSTDGGLTWEARAFNGGIWPSTTLGNYASTIWVDPLDNVDGVYIGGMDLWRSTNGALTFGRISDWTRYHDGINDNQSIDIQPHADHHIIIPSLNYSQTNRKVYIGNDGGIQTTDDITKASTASASNWDNLANRSLNITQLYAGSISPHTDLFAGGAQDNGVLLSQGGGQWKQPSTGDGSQVIFHPSNSNIVYANINFNQLLKSTNGGVSFSTVDTLGSDEALLVSRMAINKVNTDLIYLAGKSLWVHDASLPDYNATPIKAELQPLGTFDQYITAIAVDDQFRSIWVGYSSGRIEYSENGGATWSGDVSSFDMPNRAITDIDIRPFGSDGLDVLVTIGGYNQSNIWAHTESGGTSSWENISLDFDMQANTITHHPDNTDWIYVGTDVGVFASEDYGSNWSVMPGRGGQADPSLGIEGPAFVEVSDLFWFFSDSEAVYRLCAATFGRGIYRSFAVLPNAFVNRQHLGAEEGSRLFPFRFFTNAMNEAEGKGTDVTFLSAGTHNEVTSDTLLFTERVLINSELTTGFSVIVE